MSLFTWGESRQQVYTFLAVFESLQIKINVTIRFSVKKSSKYHIFSMLQLKFLTWSEFIMQQETFFFNLWGQCLFKLGRGVLSLSLSRYQLKLCQNISKMMIHAHFGDIVQKPPWARAVKIGLGHYNGKMTYNQKMADIYINRCRISRRFQNWFQT